MASPSPQEIKGLARVHGYVERRDEVSYTLFFKKNEDGDYPTLVNIFYTTRGIMTKVSHPTKGYNQLWRSGAYNSLETLAMLLENPRMHTGKGYRTADNSLRGCTQCGHQKKRIDFSKNQWRKGPGVNKCQDCLAAADQQQPQSVKVNGSLAFNNTSASVVGVHISRECITCDADGCQAVNPAIRCDICWTAYYCSKTCENRHRYEHAPYCIPIDQMRERNAKQPDDNSQSSRMRGWAMATQLSGKRTFDALLAQAEYIHQADGYWEIAMELYKELLMRDQESATPPQWRRVWMGLSRCFYEMGIYDKAIHSGMAALEMNRHFPQVHKYVALAQKASGDYEAAVVTMTRAVLYEAPWDDKNLELNKALLKQIMRQ